MKSIQKLLLILLCLAMTVQGSILQVFAEEGVLPISEETIGPSVGAAEGSLELPCKSAILMEANTGTILYTQNAEEALPPASVTKIMTLLLVMEAVDAGTLHLEDRISVSANAASMGGSQVYLKEGEIMTVEDLLKSVVIASANDAAVALAEYICGSIPAFVEKMNTRARQLGMQNTVFENVTGLDDTAERHLTSAHDIALMSQALISHKTILQYSSIWMDTIRDGEFGLTNTNRLVRFYPGCTGLKTGSTSKAGFCVSATAERDGMSLICVIMGAESRDVRNATATQLLDWGFANYGIYSAERAELDPLVLQGGCQSTCKIAYDAFSCVLPKNEISLVEITVTVPEKLPAPIFENSAVGEAVFSVKGRVIGTRDVVALEQVERINFFQIFRRMLTRFLLI